jgi:hypothetical protein
MSDLLDQAVSAVRRLDPARQDEIATIIQMLATDEDDDFTAEDEAAIELSQAESACGEYATDEEVAAVWRKYGL